MLNGGADITGATNFLNTGGVTLGNDVADISTFAGGITSTASAISIGGTVRTAGQAMNLGATTLATNVALDTTNNGANASGGAIALGAVTGNARNLSVNAGTGGAIAANSTLSGLGALSVANASSATFTGDVGAASIATAANNFAVALNGGTTVTGTGNFLNSGGVALGNDAADVSTFLGGLTSTASTTSIGGALRTAGQTMNFGPLNLASNATIDSTNNGANAGGGAIALGVLNGAGRSLTLNTGNAALALNGNVGSLGRLGSFNVAKSGSIAIGPATTVIAGPTEMHTSGAITGGTLNVNTLGIAARSAQLSNSGNIIGGVDGVAAASFVTMLRAPTIGDGPYMINGVPFTNVPVPVTTTASNSQITQLVRVPTVTPSTQFSTPTPRSNTPSSRSSPSSFEPAAGPQPTNAPKASEPGSGQSNGPSATPSDNNSGPANGNKSSSASDSKDGNGNNGKEESQDEKDKKEKEKNGGAQTTGNEVAK